MAWDSKSEPAVVGRLVNERGSQPRGALAAGSVSLRLYPTTDDPVAAVAGLCAQAEEAEACGFDGVMTSEHHGGFPNYVPNPLLAALFALGATERIWAAPCPVVLPLRPAAQVVEDLAWSACRFPGRLGAGFAAGALAVDFELAGVPFAERTERFTQALELVVGALRPGRAADGPLRLDPAVARGPGVGMPLVVAAQSVRAVERAAALGVGVLYDSLQHPQHLAALTSAYRRAGGCGPVVAIRRAHVGPTPTEAMDRQRRRYESYAPAATRAHWDPDDGIVDDTDPTALAERLAALARAIGADALNLRVFLAGMAESETLAQIEALGAALPTLRQRLGRTAAPRPGQGGGPMTAGKGS
jgi:alkanesulfonate monooxygenase SsuD/methylene tetrahydromethanopterin reductase-like flavin-dependent oxidoreductase (luciferase family)